MEPQIFIAFIVFSISMTITPGAGNLMLLGISNRYGFKAALPFVTGTTLGVLFVFIGASAGLYSLLLSRPELYIAVKYAGAAYLLYTAWGITKQEITESQETVSAIGMTSGILIQVLNPKAWIAAMTIFSQFTDATGDYVIQVSVLIFFFVLVTALCTLVWAYSGTILKHALKSTHQMLIVNRFLGLTLAATVAYMLYQS
ncbi:LysE family translocator [Vibrio cyclitrophicus]